MAPGFKDGLDSCIKNVIKKKQNKKKSSRWHYANQRWQLQLLVTLNPRGKWINHQSSALLKRWQKKTPSPQHDWQSLTEEEDYKHDFVLMERLSFPPHQQPPSRHFCFEQKLDKDTGIIRYSASEGFLGTVSGLGTFTALRCFWGVRKNTSDPERRLRISPLCVFKGPSCPLRWVKADDGRRVDKSAFSSSDTWISDDEDRTLGRALTCT